jgi:hypothetical protein
MKSTMRWTTFPRVTSCSWVNTLGCSVVLANGGSGFTPCFMPSNATISDHIHGRIRAFKSCKTRWMIFRASLSRRVTSNKRFHDDFIKAWIIMKNLVHPGRSRESSCFLFRRHHFFPLRRVSSRSCAASISKTLAYFLNTYSLAQRKVASSTKPPSRQGTFRRSRRLFIRVSSLNVYRFFFFSRRSVSRISPLSFASRSKIAPISKPSSRAAMAGMRMARLFPTRTTRTGRFMSFMLPRSNDANQEGR